MMRLIADMMNRTERRVELEGRFPDPTMVIGDDGQSLPLPQGLTVPTCLDLKLW